MRLNITFAARIKLQKTFKRISLQLMAIKRFVIVTIILLIAGHKVFSQYRFEIGGHAGGTSYIGEANPTTLFGDMNPMYGAIVRYNNNYRYAIKANIFKGSVSGDISADNPNIPGLDNDLSFQTDYFDFGVNLEYNFFPYTREDEPKASPLSPYIFAGLGATFIPSGDAIANFPFGLGVKYMVTERINIGAELGMRKLFADNVENNSGIDNPANSNQSRFVNNDYYTNLSFFITFSFANRTWQCANL